LTSQTFLFILVDDDGSSIYVCHRNNYRAKEIL
jgi:hypothetical protein